MKTSEFISALRAAPENQLLFVGLGGHTVPGGYHLTELKAASFDTVDCGGQMNRWKETIVQLWVPNYADSDYMSAGKFLKIFDKVRGKIGLDVDAEVRIEYGDDNFFPSIYYIRSVSHDGNFIRVLLEPPATTCKARDRRLAALPASEPDDSCCFQAESCC